MPERGGPPPSPARSPDRPSALAACVLVVLLHSAPPVAAAAAWYENYQAGLGALQAQDWRRAVAEITAAIGKRSEPGFWVRTHGNSYVNYLPYLKLGIAYFNLGEYEKALNAFETEESFGQIQRSDSDMRNLQTLRELARAAQASPPEPGGKEDRTYAYVETITTKGPDGEDRQVQARYFITAEQLVEKSLERALARESEGRIDEAVSALGPGLAVDPGNAALTGALDRLRGKIAEREAAHALQDQIAAALRDGRDHLAAGRYEAASSSLQQALALDPANGEATALLAESRSKLREQIEAGASREAARRQVERSLADARRLEESGLYREALEALQAALAADPGHAPALELQSSIVKKRQEIEATAARGRTMERLLKEGIGLVQGGDYERAVGTLNRLIALEPGHEGARTYLASAFALMNEKFLRESSAPPTPKLPPVIAIANAATAASEAGPGGEPAPPEEKVSRPAFVLSGIILDDQPVLRIAFHLADPGTGRDLPSRPADIVFPEAEKVGNLYRYAFAHAVALNPGLSAVRIVASDADDLDAETIHRIRYVPPLWRTPAFYGGAGAILLAAAGVAQGVRMHRRRRLVKRRFNPYVAGAPVLSERLFMGRENLLSRILQTVHNNSILLYGERRIGKTSVQHHLRRRLRQLEDSEYEFFPVYIDLQGTPQERFFATLAGDIFQELAPLLGGLEPDPRIDSGGGYAYETFVRDLRKVIKALKARSARRAKLVLLIDEVDELNDYDPKINQKLRSLFMKSFAEDMVAVVSGVAIQKHWESEGSPWYNFFEEIRVPPFDRRDAIDLIERPIQGVFRLDEGVTDAIIGVTGCKPYLIQKVCVELVNRLHEQGRRVVTMDDVRAVGQPSEG